MNIENDFNIGDRVYLKTDPEQLARIVTAISISIVTGKQTKINAFILSLL